jgi:hypothetical protein
MSRVVSTTRAMMARAAITLVACALNGNAFAQQSNQCAIPGAPGHLDANKMKTVVITDVDVLQRQRGSDLSLAQTLGTILRTAKGAAFNTVGNREDLLKTLIDTFGQATLKNEDSDLTFNMIIRPKEAALDPKELLDPEHPNGMQLVGVFNRFDLAPATFSYCGEHRLVYARKHPLNQMRHDSIASSSFLKEHSQNQTPELVRLGASL